MEGKGADSKAQCGRVFHYGAIMRRGRLEKILLHLFEHGSVAEAARVHGVCRATVYRMRLSPDGRAYSDRLQARLEALTLGRMVRGEHGEGDNR